MSTKPRPYRSDVSDTEGRADRRNRAAAQTDHAKKIISFFRMKMRWRGQQPPQIRFGKEVKEILATVPKNGPLFPYLITVRPGDRTTEFKQRCAGLGIEDVPFGE